jgi:hypothetical protein
MTSPGRRSLLPSRRETRKRHSVFLQIKNSSKRETPLRALRFRVTRETEDSPRLGSGPRTPGLFPSFKFTPNKRAFSRANSATSTPGRLPGSPTREDTFTSYPFIERRVGCVQCRELRTTIYVPACSSHSFRIAPPALSNRGVFCSRFELFEGTPGSTAQVSEPFLQDRSTICSTKQSAVSSHLRWKYRTCSQPEEQMP